MLLQIACFFPPIFLEHYLIMLHRSSAVSLTSEGNILLPTSSMCQIWSTFENVWVSCNVTRFGVQVGRTMQWQLSLFHLNKAVQFSLCKKKNSARSLQKISRAPQKSETWRFHDEFCTLLCTYYLLVIYLLLISTYFRITYLLLTSTYLLTYHLLTAHREILSRKCV